MDAQMKGTSSEDALTIIDTEDESEETVSLTKSVITKKSRGSRVSVKTPSKFNFKS